MNCVSFLTVLIRLPVAKLSKNVPRALIALRIGYDTETVPRENVENA